MKVLNNIAKAITKNYPGKKININDITQGFTTPSFTLQLVNHRDTTIAGVKFNKVYTVDVIYHGERDLDIFQVADELIDKITLDIQDFKVLNYEIEIIDKEAHTVIELMECNIKKVNLENDNSFYSKLKKTIEKISQKKCDFINTDLTGIDLKQGIFIIQPQDLSTETISINHKKQYDRTINLIYLEDNYSNIMPSITWFEKKMKLLCEDLELRKNYINMDYSVSFNYGNDDEIYNAIVNINAELTVKER